MPGTRLNAATSNSRPPYIMHRSLSLSFMRTKYISRVRRTRTRTLPTSSSSIMGAHMSLMTLSSAATQDPWNQSGPTLGGSASGEDPQLVSQGLCLLRRTFQIGVSADRPDRLQLLAPLRAGRGASVMQLYILRNLVVQSSRRGVLPSVAWLRRAVPDHLNHWPGEQYCAGEQRRRRSILPPGGTGRLRSSLPRPCPLAPL